MRRYGMAIVMALLAVVAAPQAARADASLSVDVRLFHDALAPQGRWIHHARYGEVWTPAYVQHGWRPYSVGHWVYTDYGWTWASDEDWGWATYHYGRWVFDPDEGWLWVPGGEWAPAWVAWRSGGGYVGWAPLPPADEVRFGVRFEARIDPFAYCFVEERHLMHPTVFSLVVPVARNVTYLRVTENFTHYDLVDRRVFNRGIEVERIERVTGHAVPRFQVHELESMSRSRVDAHSERFLVFRPSERVAVTPLPPPSQHGHHDDLHTLDRAEVHEREHLQAVQRNEEHHPPAGVSRDELRERHAAEQRAQQEHEAREREAAKRREAERSKQNDKHDDKHRNPHQR